jgi:hypothetical protein
MAGRSLAGLKPYIKKEATHGDELLTTMIQLDGLRMVRLGRGGSAESFKGGTGKTASGVILSDTWAEWSLTPASCYRALGFVAASRISTPTTTTPGGGTLSKQHVFTINPNAIDTSATYTLVWTDGTIGFKSSYNAFQSLGFTAERGSVEVSSNMIGRKPVTTAVVPTTPTSVALKPIQPNLGDIWIDSSWATLGTTQYLSAYQYDLQLGDKFDMDAPINSSISSFATLPEKEDQSMSLSLSVAVDTAGNTLAANYDVGTMIAVRYKIIGPIIETTIPYSAQWDCMAVITEVGEVTAAPNSNIATLPLTCEIATDGTNALALTLVNDVVSY